MKLFLRLVFTLLPIGLLTISSCQQEPVIITNVDLTENIVGSHVGNYVVNYEASPQNNQSNQITINISKVSNTSIRVDAQGGDSFECTISGSATSLSLSNLSNTTGVFDYGTYLEGAYANGRVYYKITGNRYGGPFIAEFTAI